MRTTIAVALLPILALIPAAAAQEEPQPAPTFDQASSAIQAQLEQSLAQLAHLREEIAAEKLPLSRQLSELEAELDRVRQEYQDASRTLDTRALDLSVQKGEITTRRNETTYLSNLLADYIRNFEAGLDITELQRYAEPLDAAKLAPENSNLSEQQVLEEQAQLLGVSLDRLFDALGGTRFDGRAVDPHGLVSTGTFALVGPIAVFRAANGSVVGSAEQRLGSLEPAVLTFPRPEDGAAAELVVREGAGSMPLDPTLGNAHKVAATEETLWEHIQAGGTVMVPIFVMAGSALLVALFKLFALLAARKPSPRHVRALLEAVRNDDESGARNRAEAIGGPAGRMLVAGVEHLREPRELIEEVMYERVLTTRLKLQRFLPFIAICAASAPLLGLLGTVTGIINTFKMITVFGSGDVKTLSGGISEALITTEYGLIVAIPSLLLHAFLSRRAHSVIGQMETTAVAFVNEVSKASGRKGGGRAEAAGADPELVRRHVHEILGEILGPLVNGGGIAVEGAAPARTS